MESPAEFDDERAQALPVVGIGASAGGLQAIGDLLEILPTDTGLAFLFVSHLDPTHDSLLPDLLSKRTALPVVQAENGMQVAANHIYVIPPGKVMTLVADKLELAPREGASPPMPINALFRSLARRGGRTVGIVLSGTGTDGTEGVKAIKEAAGIVLAQDVASSHYPSMPESAVQTGCVDLVLPPRDIARELERISTHPYLWESSPQDPKSEAPPLNDEIAPIFAHLFEAYKADFSQYKSSTVQRRLQRRM